MVLRQLIRNSLEVTREKWFSQHSRNHAIFAGHTPVSIVRKVLLPIFDVHNVGLSSSARCHPPEK